MTPTPSRVPTPLLIAFGLVNLPLSMLMSPTAAVLPNFYLDYSAITLAGLATATLVARLFDGITDPLIGYLSDRSSRRKPWMIAGAVVSSRTRCRAARSTACAPWTPRSRKCSTRA